MKAFDEHDIPVLYDSPGAGNVDAVALAVAAVPHEAPFDGFDIELLVVRLYVYESSGANDTQEPQIRLPPMQHLVWGLHATCGVWRSVTKKSCREHELPPEKPGESAVGEHTPNHGCKSPVDALRHAGFLRGVSASVLKFYPRLKAIVLKGLTNASFIGPQTLNLKTTRNDHRLHERLKQVESILLGLE